MMEEWEMVELAIKMNAVREMLEEGRVPDKFYRNFRDTDFSLIKKSLSDKIRNLPPLKRSPEERKRFCKLMHEAFFGVEPNLPAEQERAHIEKYIKEAIKDYEDEYKKVANVLIDLFGADKNRLDERFVKDYDNKIKVYYDKESLKITEIQTIEGEKIKDNTYKLKDGTIIKVGDELPQNLKNIKKTMEDIALAQLPVIYQELPEIVFDYDILGDYVAIALRFVYTMEYPVCLKEIRLWKKERGINW